MLEIIQLSVFIVIYISFDIVLLLSCYYAYMDKNYLISIIAGIATISIFIFGLSITTPKVTRLTQPTQDIGQQLNL